MGFKVSESGGSKFPNPRAWEFPNPWALKFPNPRARKFPNPTLKFPNPTLAANYDEPLGSMKLSWDLMGINGISWALIGI